MAGEEMDGPVARLENGEWQVAPIARGPFPGLHGGVTCAILARALELRASEAGAGLGLQLNVYLLRPTKVAPVRTETGDIRIGGRTAFFSAAMMQDGKLVANATALFVKPQTLSGPGPKPAPRQPMTVPDAAFDVRRNPGEPWFRDACEMRKGDDGTVWLRHRIATVADMGSLSFAASLADWSSGLSRPDWADRDIRAFPNADMTVHLVRAPEGAWLGVRGAPFWHQAGHGLTASELYDEAGFLGRATQTVVLAANA